MDVRYSGCCVCMTVMNASDMNKWIHISHYTPKISYDHGLAKKKTKKNLDSWKPKPPTRHQLTNSFCFLFFFFFLHGTGTREKRGVCCRAHLKFHPLGKQQPKRNLENITNLYTTTKKRQKEFTPKKVFFFSFFVLLFFF
jgi:hypothetical protein